MDSQEQHITPYTDINTRILTWLIAGYTIFLPVQFRTGLGFRLAPADLFLILYAVLNISNLRFLRKAWSFWHLALLYTFTFGLVIATAREGYVSQYALFQKYLGIIVLFAGYAMITDFATDRSRIRWVVRVLILSVVTQNIVAILAFLGSQVFGLQFSWINYGNSRLAGMLVDPNAYGGLLVLTLAIHAITYFMKTPIVAGTAGWLSLLTLSLGVVITFSRSAWIGLTVIVLFLTVLKPKIILRFALIGILVVLAILALLGPGYFDVMQAMATRGSQIEARFVFIDAAVSMFMDNPVFGVGLGVFQEKQGDIIHNTAIWLLAEFGLFGFVVFIGFSLWFIVKGLYAYRHDDERNRPLMLGLIMAHLAMLGLSIGIEALYQRHWWLIMALIAASYSLTCKEQLNTAEEVAFRQAEVSA